MARETTKAFERRKNDPFWNEVFVGDGIDIGSGDDPFCKEWFPSIRSVRLFDMSDGDAQYIARYVRGGSLDFVHSSNCLEHMGSPIGALAGWFYLLKPGGHLAFTVPDEDLYEQGVFPSKWNGGHRWSFSLCKKKSWSIHSLNIADILSRLPNAQIRRIHLADTKYDYSKHGVDQTWEGEGVEAFWEVVIRKMPMVPSRSTFLHGGARGDLMYGLATVKALGGGTLYIDQKSPIFEMKLPDDEVSGIRELLLTQDYIDEVRVWNGEEIGCNINSFRDACGYFNLLSESHVMMMGINCDLSLPWIDGSKIQPRRVADVVVNRSHKYHAYFDWNELDGWDCAFVGTPSEHESFENTTGIRIPYCPTKSWMDLAQVILGSKLFVGNQSFVYSLAEAMKHPRVLEVCDVCPNSDPQSDNGHVRLSQDIIGKYVLGKEYQDIRRESRSPNFQMNFRIVERKLKLPVTCIVINDDGSSEVNQMVTSAKRNKYVVVVSTEPGSFEEQANREAKRATGQVICIVDAATCRDFRVVESVVSQVTGGRTGMVGTCVSMGFRPHVSGPCFAVLKRYYDKVGLFSTKMLPGELCMLEMNLRYAKAKCGCKSVGLPEWKCRKSLPEWDERNKGYVERVYGVKC